MSKLQPPLIDALLSSRINADNVTIQLVIGNSARWQMYPLEIEPELVSSIVLALNQNLAEAKRIWPGKVKFTVAALVAQGIKSCRKRYWINYADVCPGGRKMEPYPISTEGIAWGVNLSADGSIITVALGDGAIRLYDRRVANCFSPSLCMSPTSAGSQAVEALPHRQRTAMSACKPDVFSFRL